MKNRWTLSVRLLVVTLIISIPVIVLILWMNSNNLKNLRDDKITESKEEVVIAVSNLDTMLELLQNSLLNLSVKNPDMMIIANSKNQSTDFWRANIRLIKKINNLNNISSFKFSIYTYFPNVDLFLNDKVSANMTKLLRDMIGNKENVPLSNRWQTVWSNGKAYVIRTIDYESYYVGAWMEYDSLYRKVGLKSDENVKYYFLDEEGRVLNSGKEMWIDYNQKTYVDSEQVKWYLTYALSKETGYRFVKLINERALKEELPKVTDNIFMVVSILILLFTVYIYCIYHWVIIPMSHMKKSMSIIEAGNMTYRIPSLSRESAEFKSVIDQFNTMMAQIENLKIEVYEGALDRQETKLQYLNQQIQPHFILNTLNTLYNYSEQDIKMTKEIILLLSKYYRHVVNVNSKYVQLGQELAHIENYLKLQKMRYPKLFEYNIQCISPLEIVPVPPFLIESFVGNAIKYGVKAEETGLIEVIVDYMDHFKIGITIRDQGEGFSDDNLDSIREYIEEGIVSEELGTGIRNAIERLRLIYDDKASIRFYNQQPCGAVIEIEISLQDNDVEVNQS